MFYEYKILCVSIIFFGRFLHLTCIIYFMGYMGIRYKDKSCAGFCGVLWGFVGFCGVLWGFVGFCGVLWGFKGFVGF
jgi:hypothetical protein